MKKTVKSVIEEGIKGGHTVDRILKSVAKSFPESKADESHIKFYSGQLKRAGTIDEEQHSKYVGKRGRKAATGTAKAKPETKAKAKPEAKAKAKAKPEAKAKRVPKVKTTSETKPTKTPRVRKSTSKK